MDRRSHERKLRSLAQWSRASLASLVKRRGEMKGEERMVGLLGSRLVVGGLVSWSTICIEVREGAYSSILTGGRQFDMVGEVSFVC